MYQVPEREYVEKGYWQPRTLGEELRISARRHADRTAVVAPDGSVSYGELDGMADEYAAGMAKLGIMPGDTVEVGASEGAFTVTVKPAEHKKD